MMFKSGVAIKYAPPFSTRHRLICVKCISSSSKVRCSITCDEKNVVTDLVRPFGKAVASRGVGPIISVLSHSFGAMYDMLASLIIPLPHPIFIFNGRLFFFFSEMYLFRFLSCVIKRQAKFRILSLQ